VGNIFEYISEGVFKQNQLMTTITINASRWISLNGFYSFGYANATTSTPVNQFSMAGEYGRAGFDVRHRANLFFTVNLPHGVRFSPMISMQSGNPYNITVGRDLNGDSFFNDRPALVGSSSLPVCKPGAVTGCVAQTPFGLLDPNPAAGAKFIPVNFGTTPGQFNFNMRIAKTFGFGHVAETAGGGRRAGGGGGPMGGGDHGPGGGGDHSPGGGGPGGMRGMGGGGGNKRYNLTLSAFARNLFNTVNVSSPVSSLSSPNFGAFSSISGFGGFGGFGRGSIPPNNRRIDLQLAFSF
jgi:hypothetical protein